MDRIGLIIHQREIAEINSGKVPVPTAFHQCLLPKGCLWHRPGRVAAKHRPRKGSKDAGKPTGPTPIVHQRPFAPWTGKGERLIKTQYLIPVIGILILN